ncbi:MULTISPECIES: YrbL family protein [unclassified Psychrobacter]|jgi:hypothetical protein|uniref:YrbL family protein n=1 Tax=unclassified Psychrobacter TaxID=196806 RepID=UPI001918571C|nr:YrbL family protein [Psychrobacter sp. JCM 18902]
MYSIKDLNLLGKGTQKLVFEHIESPDKVIKIMRPENATADGARVGQHYLRAHRSQGIYRQFRRELIQYLQLCKTNFHEKNYTFPIETVHGFVGTDWGLGLVTEKIISPSGSPKTLSYLSSHDEFTSKHAKALDQFFDECCHLHIVFGEVNIAGIMYTENRRGRPEFVLIDGIGDKLIIPFRSMSKTINTRNVRKVERKIKSKIPFYNDPFL